MLGCVFRQNDSTETQMKNTDTTATTCRVVTPLCRNLTQSCIGQDREEERKRRRNSNKKRGMRKGEKMKEERGE
jgi:hypothetical protein